MKLLRFIRAGWREQGLFLAGVAAMSVARLALLTIPFRHILEATNRLNRRHQVRRVSAIAPFRAARRISQAAAWSPVPTTCLSRTLAAYFLMSRLGYPSTPRIGVTRANGTFGAHAWLECPDGLIIGDKSPDGIVYNQVPSLERFFS